MASAARPQHYERAKAIERAGSPQLRRFAEDQVSGSCAYSVAILEPVAVLEPPNGVPADSTQGFTLNGNKAGHDTIVVASSGKRTLDGLDDTRSPKRAKYSKACTHCQQRKTKCSGEFPCEQCRVSEVDCQFKAERRKPRTKSDGQEAQRLNHNIISESQPIPTPDPALRGHANVENAIRLMVDRIDSLEQSCSILKERLRPTTEQLRVSPNRSVGSNGGRSVVESSLSPPGQEGFRGPLSLIQQFKTLSQSIRQAQVYMAATGQASRASSPAPIRWDSMMRVDDKPMQDLDQEVVSNARAEFAKSMDCYFEYVNPQYPSMNEKHIRATLTALVEKDPSADISDAERQQFIALVNLMHAEITILSEKCSTSMRPPGWEHFCHGESILSRLTWLGQGNTMTIQCYLIAARYLLFAEKSVAAYDVIGKAIRLCWQLGLHDQRSWSGCSPLERVMKQRLFYTLYHVERKISFNVGAPPLIRKGEFDVDIPPRVEDTLFSFDEALAAEYVNTSPVDPYTAAVAKWATFCTELWDNLFSVSAQKPWSQEFLTVMDARIRLFISQLPTSLRWENNVHLLNDASAASHAIIYKSAVLLLRTNQMLLLLRQESMLSLSHDEATANNCIAIASQSIDIIATIYRASTAHSADRFTLVLFLVGCLVPLTCVILKKENDVAVRRAAAEPFGQFLALMRDMAPHFSAARHTLQRLSKIIATTERAVQALNVTEITSPLPSLEHEDLALDLAAFFDTDGQLSFGMDMEKDPFNDSYLFDKGDTGDADIFTWEDLEGMLH